MRLTPSPWKAMLTSTSDTIAAAAITNGTVAISASSGPCVTTITIFSGVDIPASYLRLLACRQCSPIELAYLPLST